MTSCLVIFLENEKPSRHFHMNLVENYANAIHLCPGGKYNQGRFGIVQKLLSDHTAEILTRERGIESVAIANLYALIPQHLNMNLTPNTAAPSQ